MTDSIAGPVDAYFDCHPESLQFFAAELSFVPESRHDFAALALLKLLLQASGISETRRLITAKK